MYVQYISFTWGKKYVVNYVCMYVAAANHFLVGKEEKKRKEKKFRFQGAHGLVGLNRILESQEAFYLLFTHVLCKLNGNGGKKTAPCSHVHMYICTYK